MASALRKSMPGMSMGGMSSSAGLTGSPGMPQEENFVVGLVLNLTRGVNSGFNWATGLIRGLVLPQWSDYERRVWFVYGLQFVSNDLFCITIAKMLQTFYASSNFLLMSSLASLGPYFFAMRCLFTFIPCPKMAAVVSNSAMVFVFVILGMFGWLMYQNYWLTYTYIMVIWPWLGIASMISRLHIERNKEKNHFSPLRHLPMLGLTGVTAQCLTMIALKEISVTDCVVLLCLDPVWAAVLGSLLMGQNRRELHFRFLKVYLIMMLLCSTYIVGEVDMAVTQGMPLSGNHMLIIIARILTVARSIYVKYSYADFNRAEAPAQLPLGREISWKTPQYPPQKYRFTKFPAPVLLVLDCLFDSGLQDTVFHGMGPYGTKDLYILTDFTYTLPVASVLCWVYETDTLKYGIFPPAIGAVGGEPPIEANLPDGPAVAKETITSMDMFKVSMLVIAFCFARIIIPWATARSLYDRGASIHAWKYRPFLLAAPFFFYDVLYLNSDISKFKVICVVILMSVCAYYRNGLWDAFKRRYYLLCTRELHYIQPSVLRDIQKRTLSEFLHRTSTDDYGFMLLETSIHHGNNVREIAQKTSLQVWDPAPSATAAWKLAASLVIKSVRRQKQLKQARMEAKAEVVTFINNTVIDCIYKAVDLAEGHGKRLELSGINARVRDKQRAFRRLKAMVDRKKLMREKRKNGQLSLAPAVLATACGGLRPTPQITFDKHDKSTTLPSTLPSVPGGDSYSHDAGDPSFLTSHGGSPPPHQNYVSLNTSVSVSAINPEMSSGDALQTTIPGSTNHTGMTRNSRAARGVTALGWSAIQGALPSPTAVVLACGDGTRGQLGIDMKLGFRKTHVMSIEELRSVDLLQVEAGGTQSFALSSRGKVWGWGSNRLMELGMRKEISQVAIPARIKSLKEAMTRVPGAQNMSEDMQAVQIATSRCATGQAHTLVLNADGEVYTFGTSAFGAMGQGPDVRQTAPLLLRMTKSIRIRQIAAGSRYSLLVTDDGQVYTFGENRRGQLGIGAGQKIAYEPERVEGALRDDPVRLVAAGDEHVIVSTESGKVYAWGANAHGQLGNGRISDSPVPCKVEKLPTNGPIVSMACGAQHTLVVTNNGQKVWAFGSNTEGQLGQGNRSMSEEKIRVFPALIQTLSNQPNRDVVQVVAAANHSLALSKNGEVFSFGSNTFGQLGYPSSGDSENDTSGGPMSSSRRQRQDEMDMPRALSSGTNSLWTPTHIKALGMYHCRVLATADTHTIVLAS
jgi:alpha-tubulin suppressor-like RCC1 family protein